jgi:hypothetical protein
VVVVGRGRDAAVVADVVVGVVGRRGAVVDRGWGRGLYWVFPATWDKSFSLSGFCYKTLPLSSTT